MLICRETGHVVFYGFHLYGFRVNQDLAMKGPRIEVGWRGIQESSSSTLFVTQRDHGIYPGGTPSGDETGAEGDGAEKDAGRHEG
ncbi:MAG: hypothetical protein QOF56_299 [Acidobacteriaceae bacterium]|nr:hypothetical protein [Acidobacteriaceae bacterium]